MKPSVHSVIKFVKECSLTVKNFTEESVLPVKNFAERSGLPVKQLLAQSVKSFINKFTLTILFLLHHLRRLHRLLPQPVFEMPKGVCLSLDTKFMSLSLFRKVLYHAFN